MTTCFTYWIRTKACWLEPTRGVISSTEKVWDGTTKTTHRVKLHENHFFKLCGAVDGVVRLFGGAGSDSGPHCADRGFDKYGGGAADGTGHFRCFCGKNSLPGTRPANERDGERRMHQAQMGGRVA